MFDHYADALPDDSLLHHLATIDGGGHQVNVQEAAAISDILGSVRLPGGAGHVASGLMEVLQAALAAASEIVEIHDSIVQWHAVGFPHPFDNV